MRAWTLGLTLLQEQPIPFHHLFMLRFAVPGIITAEAHEVMTRMAEAPNNQYALVEYLTDGGTTRVTLGASPWPVEVLPLLASRVEWLVGQWNGLDLDGLRLALDKQTHSSWNKLKWFSAVEGGAA